MIKVVCWNIHRLNKSLDQLAEMAENEEADIGLLQEVGPGMARKLRPGLETGSPKHWDSGLWSRYTRGRWPIVVKMSDRVDVEWFDQVGQDIEPSANEIALSRVGLLAVARVIPKDSKDGEPFIVVSIHAHWERNYGSSQTACVIAKDISALIDRAVSDSQRVLVAGDFNINYKRAPRKDELKPLVWDRMENLGLKFMGPQYPEGRKPKKLPIEVPADSKNVVTFHLPRQSPETGGKQLDYVFASRGFHERVKTRALNSVEEWGASDHCRIMIEVAP